jgi:hypothetical protein
MFASWLRSPRISWTAVGAARAHQVEDRSGNGTVPRGLRPGNRSPGKTQPDGCLPLSCIGPSLAKSRPNPRKTQNDVTLLSPTVRFHQPCPWYICSTGYSRETPFLHILYEEEEIFATSTYIFHFRHIVLNFRFNFSANRQYAPPRLAKQWPIGFPAFRTSGATEGDSLTTFCQQEPAIPCVLHQAAAGLHESLLRTGEGPLIDPLRKDQPSPQVPWVVSDHCEVHVPLTSR